jgi:hypothetical protein
VDETLSTSKAFGLGVGFENKRAQRLTKGFWGRERKKEKKRKGKERRLFLP